MVVPYLAAYLHYPVYCLLLLRFRQYLPDTLPQSIFVDCITSRGLLRGEKIALNPNNKNRENNYPIIYFYAVFVIVIFQGFFGCLNTRFYLCPVLKYV